MVMMGVSGQYSQFFLLPAYIVFETTRALITYSATHAGVNVSPPWIALCTESSKALFTTFALLRSIHRDHGIISLDLFLAAINSISVKQSGNARWKAYGIYAIPSILYLISNLLYLVALRSTTPALLHVAILAKLPLTAIVHHLLIRRQNNTRAWASLLLLCVGLVVTNVAPDFLYQALGGASNRENQNASAAVSSFTGVIMGLIIAVISSFTGIYTEVVMKQKVPFWVAQFWLYILGSGFAAIAYISWDDSGNVTKLAIASNISPKTSPAATLFLASSAIVLATTATGLVVANILRKSDNLVKLVGTSASIVTIILGQCLLIPALRRSTLTVQTIAGAGLVSIATWCYHFYKQQNLVLEHYQAVSDFEEVELSDGDAVPHEHEKENQGLLAQQDSTTMEPTPFRVTALVLFVIFLAVATMLFRSPVSPQPQG